MNILNEAQQQAVDFGAGALLVVSCPGSGKTRVIVHRVASLIQRGVPPGCISLLTFTRKAAESMRDRLTVLIGGQAEEVFAGTFHSWAYRLLRDQRNGNGIAVVDDPRRPISKIIRALKMKLDAQEVARQIMLAQQRLLGPDVYAQIVQGDLRRADIAQVYAQYTRWKQTEGQLDYGDMVPMAIQVLEDPRQLALARIRCKHLLIDEFHDTSYDQNELMRQLVGANGNVTVVCDGDQAIYGFRGSDVRFIEAFREQYPRHVMIKLGENYRSTPQILAPALKLIRHNEDRIDKPLTTRNPSGEEVQVGLYEDPETEASAVAQQIASRAAGRWGECAVLYRVNAQALAVESALFEAEIPFSVSSGKPFFELSEVKWLLAYLRLARNPLDDAALKSVLNIPPRYLGPEASNALQTVAAEGDTHLYQALDFTSFPKAFQAQKAREFKRFIGTLGILNRSGPVQVLREVRERGGFDAWLLAESDDEPDNERGRNVDELCRVAERWQDTGQFLSHVIAVSKASKGKGNRVHLLTCHRSKGLEFPYVWLIGAVEGLCPHERAAWVAGGEEEERRLFYVGMTRAMKNLTITVPERMWRKPTVPSRFLYEAELLEGEEE